MMLIVICILGVHVHYKMKRSLQRQQIIKKTRLQKKRPSCNKFICIDENQTCRFPLVFLAAACGDDWKDEIKGESDSSFHAPSSNLHQLVDGDDNGNLRSLHLCFFISKVCWCEQSRRFFFHCFQAVFLAVNLVVNPFHSQET